MLTDNAIRDIIQRAFAEDLPDVTTEAIFDAEERGTAQLLVKERGVFAGAAFARAVFAMLDPDARFEALVADGTHVEPGSIVATVHASVRALLSGERTALNLVQRASGIATTTRRYVDAVAGTRAKIYDTRKTAPGLRALDKYAVKAGGGENHRHSLHDMVLIKNNHIDRAGSIGAAVDRIRARGVSQPIMIEVRDFEELEDALEAKPDFILLDNMPVATLARAVDLVAGAIPLEASGGITLENVREVAETGVDRISVGALTHSVKALDISMKVLSSGF